MLFTLQKRMARAPIVLPMDVREDMVRNGTRGPVLLLLESCDGMTTDVENWVKFRVKFPRLDIWIAIAPLNPSDACSQTATSERTPGWKIPRTTYRSKRTAGGGNRLLFLSGYKIYTKSLP